jgi:hypothetical protein
VYGFFSRWALGVVLGYLVAYSSSLWPAIAGHFAYNTANVLLVQLAGMPLEAEATEGLQIPAGLGLASLAAVGAGLWYYRQKLEPLQPKVPTFLLTYGVSVPADPQADSHTEQLP